MTVEDIRWTKVRGSIKRDKKGFTTLVIDVKFDGMDFHSKTRLHPEDRDLVTQTLDEMVRGIDKLMIEHGVNPYKIESHA